MRRRLTYVTFMELSDKHTQTFKSTEEGVHTGRTTELCRVTDCYPPLESLPFLGICSQDAGSGLERSGVKGVYI